MAISSDLNVTSYSIKDQFSKQVLSIAKFRIGPLHEAMTATGLY